MRCDVLRLPALILGTLLLCGGHVTAAPVTLSRDDVEVEIGSALTVYADPAAEFTASDVLAAKFAAPSLTFSRQPPNLGYPRHRHWLRVDLRNDSDTNLDRLLVFWRGSAHQIHVFSQTGFGPIRDLGAATDVVSRHAVTQLHLPAGATTRLALRIDSASALALDLRVTTVAELANADRRDYLWFGLFVGIVLAIAIYVFAIYVALRDRLYLLFVAFAAGNVVYQLLSEGYLYSWLPLGFRPIGNALANLSGGAFVICIMMFVRGFLRLWETSPRSDRLIFKPLMLVMLTAFPVFLIKAWVGNTLIALGTIVATVLVPVVSWQAMRHHRPVLSFHLAAILFFVSGSVHLLKRMGIVADAPWLSLVLQIGSALIVIAFSIAVLQRVRRIAEENRAAARSYAERLEVEVAERTRELDGARLAAEAALAQKTAAQRQLVEAEKMISLGQLVAGVAHEVNTPIGVAYTAGSHLDESTRRFAHLLAQDAVKRSDLDAYVDTAQTASGIISRNLERAAQLIRSFKQVSVDRTSDGRRIFVLDRFLQELIDSLVLTWKGRPITLDVQCPASLAMDSFPGALGQVLTNLIQNSLLHAFESQQPGHIIIAVRALDDARFEIAFSDDGRGVDANELARIFEPFYTTKRNQGGTGLGLHVVYNLVTQKLGGRIDVHSAPGHGLQVLLSLPRAAPAGA